MNQTDLSLFNLIKAGDLSAFEKLFNTHYPVLCVYAKKIVGDIDEARDIVQGVFVKVYERRDTLEINTSIKAYLYRSVYHACLNHLKHIKTHNHHHESLKYYLPLSEDHDAMIKAELEERIWEIIQNLPEQCRRIFEMNRFEGKKNREIAEILGISVRTVETQISKALKVLRKNLTGFFTAIMLFTTVA